jgi:transposase InsO family protein
MNVSERRACRAHGQHRSTLRKAPRGRNDEVALTADLVELAERYGRYGYRKISALLKAAGWLVNDKRVERIWRREGLKVPARQPKRNRIWDEDGSCLRLRAERRDHIWSYDFVEARTHEGRKFRMLNVVDAFTREALAIEVDQGIKGEQVVAAVARLALLRGAPRAIQVDNGPEFVSKALDRWAYGNGVTLDFSRPGKPTDNAVVESFNGRLRDECLNVNWFLSLADARSMIETWRRQYNESRPHTALGWLTPQEFALAAAQQVAE